MGNTLIGVEHCEFGRFYLVCEGAIGIMHTDCELFYLEEILISSSYF